jgi:uncharacterized protein (TIGR02145 family)
MSSGPLPESGGVYSWDFTNLQSKAYQDGQKYIGGGKYGMLGGDCDASGRVDILDKNDFWNANAGVAGYYASDANMDTEVNNPDKDDIWLQNKNEKAKLPEGVVFICGTRLVDERNDHVYNTVEIGNQCWMAENLDIGIRKNSNINQTDNGSLEKYCYYDNPVNCQIYGGLYQWDEAMAYNDTVLQGICPDGWHIPSNYEWVLLTDYLGGQYVAGGKLKEAGYTHWDWPNTGATNISGFTALPGGLWNFNGYYDVIHEQAYFWSSTNTTANHAWDIALKWNTAGTIHYNAEYDWAESIRCIFTK